MTTDFASRRALLALARHAIAAAVGASIHPEHTAALPVFDERRGAFVTLTRAKRLRGCIGRLEPDGPLRTLIPSVARSAALEDPRFRAVTADELPELLIEISLLGTPETVSDWTHVEVGVHGLVIRASSRRGLLLPQVATQYGWTREEFISQTCLKAGLSHDAWRHPGSVLQSFRAEVFCESEFDEPS